MYKVNDLEEHPVKWCVEVRVFKNASGNKFGSISDSSNYIPMSDLRPEDQQILKECIVLEEVHGEKIWFSTRPCKPAIVPTEEGKYILEGTDCWIDKREEFKDKHIIRVKNAVFTKLD